LQISDMKRRGAGRCRVFQQRAEICGRRRSADTKLLREMQREKKQHMRIVIDEYGGKVAGLVTIEDLAWRRLLETSATSTRRMVTLGDPQEGTEWGVGWCRVIFPVGEAVAAVRGISWKSMRSTRADDCRRTGK